MSNAASRDAPPGSYVANYAVGTLVADPAAYPRRPIADPGAEVPAPVDTTRDQELGRYHAVIHLRTPAVEHGYNHQNPLRTESPARAAEIDARIAQAWARHSRRLIVESSSDFLDYGYGWYVTLICVPLYNVLSARSAR